MKIPSQDLLLRLLSYSPETGSLKWKTRDREMFSSDKDWKWWNGRFAGKEAGSVSAKRTGYARITVDINIKSASVRGAWRAHRLIWVMVYGYEPKFIDHINGDATDNRLSNLRECTKRENARNRSKSIKNTSGITGVNWSKQCRKWRAEYCENGKNVYLGLFAKKEDAATAVKKARAGKGYTDRHGEDLPVPVVLATKKRLGYEDVDS